MFFSKHFFSIAIVLLLALSLASIYFRFFVLEDYLVKSEIECDPLMEVCFEACVDDQCTETYFHAYAVRQAKDLKQACGSDITDCEAAMYCDPDVIPCDVVYCDPAFQSCDTIQEDALIINEI